MRDPLGAFRSRVIPLRDRATALAFSDDGSEIAITTERGSFVADAVTGATRKARKRASKPSAVNATYVQDEGVAIVDVATGERRALHRTGPAYRIALSVDGSRVVASGHEGTWEGPCEGPLVWLPEEGPVAHGGAVFAIGDALFHADRDGSNGPFAWLPNPPDVVALSPAGDRACISCHGATSIIDVGDLVAPPWVGPTSDVKQLSVDAEGQRLAAIDQNRVVCVWSIADGRLLAAFRVAGYEPPIAWARDGSLLVGGGAISVWDVEQRRRTSVHRFEGLHAIERIHVHSGGVIVRDRSALVLLDASYAPRAKAGPWDDTSIDQSDVSHDGATVYVARGHSHSTLAISTTDGSTTAELPPARAVVAGDGILALATDSGSISRTGAVLTTTDGHEEEPMDPFSQGAAVGDGILSLYDDVVSLRARGEPRWRQQYRDDIYTLAIARDTFFTSGRATWVGQRSLEDGRLLRVLGSHACGKVVSLAFDPSGTRLAAGEMEGRLHVWSLGDAPTRIGLLDGTTLQAEGTIREPGHVGEIGAIAFTSRLVACTAQNKIMTWDGDFDRIGHVEPRVVEGWATRVSRDGRRFVSGDSWGQEVIVIDESGAELARLPGVEARDRFCDVSDDGARILVASHNHEATEISIYGDRGEGAGTLRIEHAIETVGFDGRGRVVGCLHERPTFFRWDPATREVERWCTAPPIVMWGVAQIARGGGRIVLWGGGQAYVLDEESGALVASLPKPAQDTSVTAVAISDDGTRVALADWSGAVRLFAIRVDGAQCIAVMSGTSEGGWWSIGSAGFTHVPKPWEAS